MPLIYRRLTMLVLLALLIAFAPVASPVYALTRTVTTINDSGAGSLRQAMTVAVAGDTINFNISTGAPPWTIGLQSPLPALDKGNVTIDGGANHQIVLDGSLVGAGDGFLITSSNNTIKGMVIINFPNDNLISGWGGAGIHIVGTDTNKNDKPIVSGNKILGNWIGVAADGVTAAPNADFGVLIDSRSSGNTIGGTTEADRNVIAGNGTFSTTKAGTNVIIYAALGPTTAVPINNNKIIGNYIGTTSTGLAVIGGGNPGRGVVVGEWAQNNTVGGTTTAERNIIAGHTDIAPIESAGVEITGLAGKPNTGNIVAGNYIGVGANGTTSIPNHVGIMINGSGTNATTNTMLGGPTAASRNVVSSSVSMGILVQISGVSGTTIANNWIGLSAAGAVLGNGASGVRVWNGASATTLGPGNVIAATTAYGVYISASNNIVKGNFIGTNSTGTLTNASFATNQASVLIDSGTGNQIGGTTAADRNVIALSDGGAAIVLRSPSSGTTVQGNYIGVTASGSTALNSAPPTGSNGILISPPSGGGVGSSNNIIGGAAAGAGNIIGGADNGIQISGSNNNQVKGNSIGVGIGNSNVGNKSYGIWLLSGPTGNQIGGNAAGEGNTIAYNAFVGVYVQSASNNTIAGNTVRNNGNYGVEVNQSTGVLITQTETSSNTFGDGIRLSANGNNLLAAPSNLAFALVAGVPRLTGNACANCTIEIFVSPTIDNGEGPRYLTSATTDGNGAFNVAVTGCDRYLTATARNATNDTSPFTTPMEDAGAAGCEAPEPLIQLSAGTPASSSGTPNLANPGTSVIYSHVLTNIGTASGNFTLSRTSSPGWASQPNVTSVTLDPGESQTIQMTVSVPAGATPDTTEDTTLTAAVLGQTSVQQHDYTRVRQVANLILGPVTGRNGSVTPGNSIDYTHYITNTGNGADTFVLTAKSNTPSTTIAFPNGTTCTLNVNAGCQRVVRVGIAAGNTNAFDTTAITATSQFNSAIFKTVNDTTQITQVPIPQISAGTSKNASPPTTVQFTHTVRNVGGLMGQFTASVIPPSAPGWNFVVTPAAPFTLQPNGTQIVTLTVTVPASAVAGESVTAQVKVLASSGAQATASDTVNVLLVPNLSFSPAAITPVSGQPGQLVSFAHTLTNNGNGPDSFTIVLTSTPGLINLSRTPVGQINLAKGQSIQVVVSGQIANGALAGAQTIGATAQRLSAPLQSITRVDTVNIVGAAVPLLTAAQPQTTTLPLPATRIFTHTLTNIGNQVGTFTLGAVAPLGWTATPSSPACLTNLPQGSTCQFTVQVNVPAGTFAGAHQVVVTATASSSASVNDIVNVPPDPDLIFTPDYNGTADPGEVFTYTHSLTNTGNITDSFEIKLLVDSGWSALARPAVVASVPPGATRSVAIVITAPEGVSAGSTGTVTATAKSAFAPFPSQSVLDRTTINAKPGARLIPSQQTLSANPTQTLSDTATFMHILRNSGSIPISYTLSASSLPPGWTASISPTQVGPISPGAEAAVALAITVPANTPFGEVTTTTLRVQQLGGPPDDLATALDTTVIGPLFGAMLTPSRNDQQALPGATVIYTHTLRNTGAQPDTFLLTTIAPNGWDTNITPPSINLARNASSTITVTVRVPTSAISGTLDIATVQAQSVSDRSAAPGTAQEHTTVLHVAGVSLSPPRYRTAIPGQTIEFQHTLVNIGNGLDTFTLAATISGTGVLTWPVTIEPLSIRLIQGDSYPVVLVRVQVPASAARNASGRVTVTATSRSDPTAQDQLIDQIRGPDFVSGLPWPVYFPIIIR